MTQLFVRFFSHKEWRGTSHQDWMLSSREGGSEGIIAVSASPILLTCELLFESSSGWIAETGEQQEAILLEFVELANKVEEAEDILLLNNYRRTGETTCVYELTATAPARSDPELVNTLMALIWSMGGRGLEEAEVTALGDKCPLPWKLVYGGFAGNITYWLFGVGVGQDDRPVKVMMISNDEIGKILPAVWAVINLYKK